MLQRLPPFVKNFYFISFLCFLIWMLFLDSNDFINQFAMRGKLNDLKKEKVYYEEKILEVKEERKSLTDKRQLEKFARENYLMKKKSEDVYVIVKE